MPFLIMFSWAPPKLHQGWITCLPKPWFFPNTCLYAHVRHDEHIKKVILNLLIGWLYNFDLLIWPSKVSCKDFTWNIHITNIAHISIENKLWKIVLVLWLWRLKPQVSRPVLLLLLNISLDWIIVGTKWNL